MQQVVIQRSDVPDSVASECDSARVSTSGAKEPTASANDTNYEVIATVGHARRFWQRLRGLLGKKTLAADGGLLITPCSQVHTLGMRLPLDVVFLNAEGVVVKCVAGLRPGRIAGARGAKHTLELAVESIARLGLQNGDRLRWSPVNEY